jgi:sulfatase modifying factor 1
VTRNGGDNIFLTSEAEWYKAAYYDAVSTSYFDYPAGTDTQTVCATPGATANTANCDPGGPVDLTDVGSYTGSASPYGTFDQGGNVWEWNEAIIASLRGLRGGAFLFAPDSLAASYPSAGDPTGEFYYVGFRVASPIPEPGTGLLVMTGVLGLAGWRRRCA